ncbi:alpha/beta hydrolase family protein [Pelagicoccus albus]|uniref:S9 family peptidase n=1 Tax=Pelagicoccus albus TaxID=415222 RepID=A0A7X1B694_9BACT|nr:alpha/beta fold hydrolase [Pelagicoccus albus]MBC2605160.1 S9 family peptidase [Pelagicoccus albus]
MKTNLLSLIILALALLPFAHAKSKKIKPGNTPENFLRPPAVFDMKMSPDGKYAVSVAPIDDKGERGIVIFDLDSLKVLRSTNWPGRDIASVHWTSNEDVTFKLVKWDQYADGVYSFSVKKNETRSLLSNDVAVDLIDPIYDESSSWIWIQDGYEVKTGLAKLRTNSDSKVRQDDGKWIVPKTNANRLVSSRIIEPPGEIFGWNIDQRHEPRIVTRFYNGKLEFLHRYSKDEDWIPLNLDPELWSIELFGAEKSVIYISGYNGEETKGLYSYDIEKAELGPLLYRDDYYDFSDTARYLFFKDQVVGMWYHADKPKSIWFAPELQPIQNMVDGTIKNRINIIYQASDDFTRFLVYSYSDKLPPEYSVLDIKNKTLKLITKSAPWLEEDKLASTDIFHFQTPDELRLEGYLTRPPNTQAPYPTIVLVHGGPWTRDHPGYHDETQFFANKGYAVLRLNYRGSTGYGRKISDEAAYEFRAMQDDITQAVKLLVDQGIADKSRLAIMGASFGGYSALCGAVFEPELYRCAITNMGVFDWEEMIKARKWQDHQYSHFKLKEQLGDPESDTNRFEEISPIYHIENIKIPIFVVHGKNDSNVSIKQSKRLKSELEKYGIEHETLFVGGEGHNVFSLKKRLDLYQRILAFLEKNMD